MAYTVHDPDMVLATLATAQARATRPGFQSPEGYVSARYVGCLAARSRFGVPLRLASTLGSLERTGHVDASYSAADRRLTYRITEAGWRRLCALAGVQS